MSLLQGLLGVYASREASEDQQEGIDNQINFLRESRDMARADLAPHREASYSALDALMSMTGLPQTQRGTTATNFGFGGGNTASRRTQPGQRPNQREGNPLEPQARRDYSYGTAEGSGAPPNPGGQPDRYHFQTDPGYGFRYDEGLRALNTHMAAKGRSVGTAMDRSSIRYGQGMASQEYMNVYNRLAGIAGIGGAQASATAALGTGSQMGQAAAARGNAQANGWLGGYTAVGSAVNDSMQMAGYYGAF